MAPQPGLELESSQGALCLALAFHLTKPSLPRLDTDKWRCGGSQGSGEAVPQLLCDLDQVELLHLALLDLSFPGPSPLLSNHQGSLLALDVASAGRERTWVRPAGLGSLSASRGEAEPLAPRASWDSRQPLLFTSRRSRPDDNPPCTSCCRNEERNVFL